MMKIDAVRNWLFFREVSNEHVSWVAEHALFRMQSNYR